MAGVDCVTGVCTGGKCQAERCDDSVRNGTETDVDCGGPSCGKCAVDLYCVVNGDCQSGVCNGTPKKCQPPNCDDSVKNQTETDVDCGGICGATCVAGQACLSAGDCQSASCASGTCQAQATELKLQYKAGDTNVSDNQIKPHFQIVNIGSNSVPLIELKLRYWYTIDTQQSQTSYVDFAFVGSGNVNRSFSSVSPARTGADTYLEVGFTTAAGSIPAGGNSGPIEMRFNKDDWSNFNESNDYSFDATKIAFADWTRVTIYRNGVLVWGTEP
jgi:mannan endo-1,4-beta-mannosidase